MQRVTELKSRGTEGRFTVRPFMWRDALNIGVQTTDDMIWTPEHEAAHFAFRIPNSNDARLEDGSAIVRECRG